MEVRWFLRGAVQVDVREAMESWTLEDRSDLYLLGVEAGLGVKLRAGRNVELKQRTQQLGAQAFFGASAGMVERWVKWSFPLDANAAAAPPGAAWCDVRKRRWQCKYAVDESFRVQQVAVADRPAEGAGMEVTALTVREAQWWTVGIEAFARDDRLDEVFQAIRSHVTGVAGMPTLSVDASFGYPAWLQRIDATHDDD